MRSNDAGKLKGVPPGPETGWEQRLLRTPSRNSRPEYQELKFTLHRKLLDQINLCLLYTSRCV